MKPSEKISLERRKDAYYDYVKERINIKGRYYAMTFEQYLKKLYPYHCASWYKPEENSTF